MGPFQSFGQLHLRYKQIALAIVFLIIVGVMVFFYRGSALVGSDRIDFTHLRGIKEQEACYRYPKQQNYHKYGKSSTSYSFLIVADMDKASKMEEKKHWKSLIKGGTLQRDSTGKYSLAWTEETELNSQLNEAGRAMELSELAYFNGKLYTFDDRTGVVFSVVNDQAIPQHILMEGDGKASKGMKIEWATVKDSLLYVGSIGKEWTTQSGEFVSNNPAWVKTIDENGRVEHVDWLPVYTALRKATGTHSPGYLLHEAVRWNASLRRWFFLPRRVSKEMYDEEKDESRGSNTVISTNEFFGDIRVTNIGTHVPTHGFSSFQFIPFRESEILALKSEEHGDKIATYITVFDLDGRVLMEEQHVGNVKFEGLEIM